MKIPESKTITLKAFEDQIKKEIPEAQVIDYPNTSSIRVALEVSISPSYLYYFEDYLAELLPSFIEQFRNRAIRALGLNPRIQAYENEVRQISGANALLSAQLKTAKTRIGELQLALDELRKEKEQDNG